MNYYNEHDKPTAAWLQRLMDRGLIPKGEIDTRSIVEVMPDDLRGFTQCHFFAGIGGFPLALQLAGIPPTRPLWTGSCPCQPFSAAGKQKGVQDERHLWPEFHRIIKAGRPEMVLGEQVASSEVVGTQLEASFVVAVQCGDYARANKLAKRLAQSRGFHYHRRWIDGVCADLEGADYSGWFAVLGAHSAGAPHIRQRLFWVAYAESQRQHGSKTAAGETGRNVSEANGDLRLRNPIEPGLEGHAGHGDHGHEPGRIDALTGGPAAQASGHGPERLVNADSTGPQPGSAAAATTGHGRSAEPASGYGFWSDYDIIPFRDGKVRRIKSGLEPMAPRVPGRVVALKGFGNAIVPQVAAIFIRAAEAARKKTE